MTDTSLLNEDWPKAMHWDYPPQMGIEQLGFLLGLTSLSTPEEKAEVFQHFLSLPAAIPMPPQLKLQAQQIAGQEPGSNLTSAGSRTSIFVAWYPSAEVANDIALPAPFGEPADELHVTVLYLPEPPEGMSAEDVEATVKDVASQTRPFIMTDGGTAVFSSVEDEQGNQAGVMLLDSPAIGLLHEQILNALPGSRDLQTHGYTAHMTLAYNKPAVLKDLITREPVALTFACDTITYVRNDGTKVEIPLKGSPQDTV